MPKNVGDLVKFIVAKGFKRLPKVQKIAQSGHTDRRSAIQSYFSSLYEASLTMPPQYLVYLGLISFYCMVNGLGLG